MRMESVRYTGQPDILRRTQLDSGQYDGVVAEILRQVRERGDAAVAEYTERFDHVKPETSLVSAKRKSEALWNGSEKNLYGFWNDPRKGSPHIMRCKSVRA